MPCSQFSRALVAVVVLTTVPVSIALGQSPLVGTWRGTSTCVDKAAFPACTDEDVIYVVQALGAPSDSITLRADKIVGGARESMGDLHFGQAGSGTWQTEIHTGRYGGRWALTVEGGQMTGTLVDLPSGKLVRRVSLRRVSD
jgi:hypothetical protein